MGQPDKDLWASGGSVHQRFIHQLPPDTTPPNIRPFTPTDSAKHISLAVYDKVVVMGDSLMGDFSGVDYGFFGRKNMIKKKSPASALNSLTVDAWLEQFRDDFGALLEQYHNNTTNTTSRIAFLVGSCTWDLLRNDVDQRMDFEDHLASIQKLVATVSDGFPSVEVLWKSCTALHISTANIEEMAAKNKEWGIDRVRYMSESRSRHLDRLQKQLMATLQVPVLDVYEATYLAADHPKRQFDARHFDASFNRMINGWF